MYTEHVSPKLLLEFYKGEKVPPLVKKYDFQSYKTQTSAQQRRYASKYSPNSIKSQYAHMSNFNTSQLPQISHQLDKQIQQNRELRLIIKQMQQKLSKLKQVNDELIIRVQQLEMRTYSVNGLSDLSKRDILKKAKSQVYKQVQQFLKIQAQKFTESLLSIKMSPLIQKKIQQFLQQIISINSVSVKKTLQQFNYPKQRRLFDEQQANRTIKQIVQKHSKSKSRSKQKQREREMDTLRYQMVLQKLNYSQEQIRPGLIVDRSNSPNRWMSNTRPKRPRIFRKRQQNDQKSMSREKIKIQF